MFTKTVVEKRNYELFGNWSMLVHVDTVAEQCWMVVVGTTPVVEVPLLPSSPRVTVIVEALLPAGSFTTTAIAVSVEDVVMPVARPSTLDVVTVLNVVADIVLNSVSTTAFRIVVVSRVDVVIVVKVAVGTRHSIFPVCCLTSLSTSDEPPWIDAREQLWTPSPAHSLP